MINVNFDVCSIDFVMLLLNGVPFSIFVLIHDYCTHLAWMDFLMPQLCCPFFHFLLVSLANGRFLSSVARRQSAAMLLTLFLNKKVVQG